MSRKILLTGSSGLIGQPVAEMLNATNYEVVTVGTSAENAVSNFDLSVDLLSKELENNFDFVIHLAAQIPKTDSIDVHLVNRKIDENIFNFIAERKTPLIYASSASVYGPKNQAILMEESLPCFPETDYAKQKLSSELWIEQNLKEYYILRITAPYGNSTKYQGVLSTFCKIILSNRDITLYGTGSRCQDFINTQDIANLIRLIIEKPEIHSGIYNVCSGSPVSMKEVAETVIKLAKTDQKIVYSETQDSQEDFKALYNIDKLTDIFDWNPEISLEEGIIELFDFLKESNEIRSNI
jgi:nucleoside-diphosphate-sugar epimerase